MDEIIQFGGRRTRNVTALKSIGLFIKKEQTCKSSASFASNIIVVITAVIFCALIK